MGMYDSYTLNLKGKSVQINFNVIQNSVSDVVAKTGKQMKVCEVAYKDLDSGAVASLKVNSFSKLFKKATELQIGMNFTGTKEKDGDYWNWVSFVPCDQSVATVSAPAQTKGASAVAVKSTYETSEERAKKQVYIVRQTAINYAIALLSVGAKAPPTTEAIFAVATQFADWVFAEKPLSFDDMPDDIPVE
jgi:hypothetical protein